MNGPYTRFPSVAVTPAGNPVVMFMDFDSNWLTATQVATTSANGGQSYPMPVNVSGVGGSDVCDCCPGYIKVWGNTQIGSFRRNNNNLRDIWAGVSTDGGASFPTGVDTDPTNWMISMCPSTGAEMHLDSDSLYAVFMSEAWGGDTRVYISSSNITSQAAGFCTALAPNYPSTTNQNYPQITGNTDTIGVAWEQTQSGGNSDCFFAWSASGGAGTVNNEMIINSSTAGEQKNPDVIYSNGTFHFVYQNNPTGTVIYKKAWFNLSSVADPPAPGNSLSVFPNPFRDFATILVTGNGLTKLVLTDHLGRTVKILDNVTGNKIILERENLEAGVYFLKMVKTNTAEEIIKLIII
jgi:hypothetical protein